MTKTQQQALVPFDDMAREAVAKLKPGAGVFVEMKRVRNIRFHRKFFALLNLAFELWEPEQKTWKGHALTKNFERFRDDITILAGHYEAVFDINGNVKLKPKSISFANCDEDEFERVYKGVLDVVWDKILKQANYESSEDVDRVVNQLLAYS